MQQIKEMRAQMGVTQVQLAALAGMDPATLNRIEQGKANPNLKTIERLADALEVEVGDFFPKAQPPLPLDFEAAGEAERRTPVLAEALATQAAAWLRAVADATTDLDTAFGIVKAAEDLDDTLSVMLGGEESSKGLSGEDLGEITRAMKLLEDVAAQYSSRLDRAIKQAPSDEVGELRQRKVEWERSRRSATA